MAEAPPGCRLEVHTRGSSEGLSSAVPDVESGSWGIPRAASPENLTRLLLANPHVSKARPRPCPRTRFVEIARPDGQGRYRDGLVVSGPLDRAHSCGFRQESGDFLGKAGLKIVEFDPRHEGIVDPRFQRIIRFHEYLRGWFECATGRHPVGGPQVRPRCCDGASIHASPPDSLRKAVDGSVVTRFIFLVGGEDAKNLAVSTCPSSGRSTSRACPSSSPPPVWPRPAPRGPRPRSKWTTA